METLSVVLIGVHVAVPLWRVSVQHDGVNHLEVNESVAALVDLIIINVCHRDGVVPAENLIESFPSHGLDDGVVNEIQDPNGGDGLLARLGAGGMHDGSR
jgi:hypothetical protein